MPDFSSTSNLSLNDPQSSMPAPAPVMVETPSKRRRFSFKQVLAVGLIILTAFGVAAGTYLVQQQQDSRSQASTEQIIDPKLGQLLSAGANVSASKTHASFPPQMATDGKPDTFWNAGDFPAQWFQLDLLQPKTVGVVRAMTSQSPAGDTVHRILMGAQPDQLTEVGQWRGNTSNSQWLTHTLSQPMPNVRYIRIVTDQSPSWVGWREVQAYAGAPATDQGLTLAPKVWDNGLTKRCVKLSPTPTVQGMKSPYQDLSGCIAGDPNSWSLGFQAESGYGSGGVCNKFSGVNTVSNQFNRKTAVQQSPVTFAWLNQNGKLAADMKLDFMEQTHPCGKQYFNWYVFMHQNSASVYPLPTQLVSKHTATYSPAKRSGAARLIAAMSGFVRTTEGGPVESFSIEVALNLDNEWGDNFPNDPLIARCTPAECGSHHIFLDGSHFGLAMPANKESTITIPWYQIYAYALEKGLVPAPYEVSGANLSTGGVSFGFEVNNFEARQSYSARLIQSGFTIYEKK